MADRFDVVAVGVADEGAVVVLVVLRPDPRLVQDLGAQRRGLPEERVDGGAITGGEGDVRLPEAVARLLPADPEVGVVAHAVTDRLAEVQEERADLAIHQRHDLVHDHLADIGEVTLTLQEPADPGQVPSSAAASTIGPGALSSSAPGRPSLWR